MLALALALIHDPEVLLIDELSLGLAPAVVAELLDVVADAAGDRAGDDHRRAVAQRRAEHRRPGDLPREGPGPLRAARPASCSSATTWSVPCSSERTAADARRLVTRQLVVDGVVNGLVIGLIAMGLVLVYRSTRVINFAVGSLGVVERVGARAARRQLRRAVLAGAGGVAGRSAPRFGAAVDLVVVRRLFDASRVTVMVATIGVSQLHAGDRRVASRPSQGLTSAVLPGPRSTAAGRVAGVSISGPQLTILIVVPLFAAALSLFLNRTAPRWRGHRVGRQSPTRPYAGHQPEVRVDAGVVDRRAAVGRRR